MDREEKRLREQLHDTLQAMAAITDKAANENRDLTSAETAQHARLYAQAKGKRTLLENHMGYQFTPEMAQSARPVDEIFKPGNGSAQKAARPSKFLSKADSFRAQQTISDPADRLDPGAFLRAATVGPRTPAERAAIQASVTSSGYSLPVGVSAEIIDQLRQENPLIAAGARSMELPKEAETQFVSISDYPAARWHTELNEEDLDSPTFGSVDMKAKTVLSLFEVSRELEQDSSNLDEAIKAAFTGSLNRAIIAASFETTANAFTALQTAVTAEQEYVAGSLAYADFVKARRKLYDADVPEGSATVIHSPKNWEALNLLEAEGQPVRKPYGILDIPEMTSSGVPDDISYAGDFTNVVYGFRMHLSIERYPGPSARKFGSIWLAGIRLDMAVFRPSALIRIKPAAGE